MDAKLNALAVAPELNEDLHSASTAINSSLEPPSRTVGIRASRSMVAHTDINLHTFAARSNGETEQTHLPFVRCGASSSLFGP